jgi:hypothetical protein
VTGRNLLHSQVLRVVDPASETSPCKIIAAIDKVQSSTLFLNVLGDWPHTKRLIKVARAHADVLVQQALDMSQAAALLDGLRTLPSAISDFRSALEALGSLLCTLSEVV